jgi:hypothetical protein
VGNDLSRPGGIPDNAVHRFPGLAQIW